MTGLAQSSRQEKEWYKERKKQRLGVWYRHIWISFRSSLDRLYIFVFVSMTTCLPLSYSRWIIWFFDSKWHPYITIISYVIRKDLKLFLLNYSIYIWPKNIFFLYIYIYIYIYIYFLQCFLVVTCMQQLVDYKIVFCVVVRKPLD